MRALRAEAGGQARSAATPRVTVTPLDTTPPAAPQHLVAVVVGGDVRSGVGPGRHRRGSLRRLPRGREGHLRARRLHRAAQHDLRRPRGRRRRLPLCRHRAGRELKRQRERAIERGQAPPYLDFPRVECQTLRVHGPFRLPERRARVRGRVPRGRWPTRWALLPMCTHAPPSSIVITRTIGPSLKSRTSSATRSRPTPTSASSPRWRGPGPGPTSSRGRTVPRPAGRCPTEEDHLLRSRQDTRRDAGGAQGRDPDV